HEFVLGDTGGMDDTANRWCAFVVAPSHQRLQRIPGTDVESHCLDRYAAPLQTADRGDGALDVRVVDAVPIASTGKWSAPCQHQTARAVVGEPVGHQFPECTHAACDEVGRVGLTPQRLANGLAGNRN